MTRSFQIQALDHRAVVRSPDALAALLEECFAGLVAGEGDAPDDEEIDLVRVDADRWTMNVSTRTARDARVDGPGRLIVRLLEHVNRAAAISAGDAVPLHGAAVEAPDGRVVVLAGSSGSGKSTLCAAAVLHGWRLVAEEVASVDPTTLAVRPYHRPIGLRPGGAAAIGIVPPAQPFFSEVYPWCPAATSRSDGGPLTAVALVSRGSGRTDPSLLAPAPALTELIRHVVIPHDERVAVGFHRLADLVRAVPVRRLVYDTPDQGVAALEELLRA